MKNRKTEFFFWGILTLPVLWFGMVLGDAFSTQVGLGGIAQRLSFLMSFPLQVHWCEKTPKFIVLCFLAYGMAVISYTSDQKGKRQGREHGSAKWGSVPALNSKYKNRRDPESNYILSQHIRMGTDVFRHQHNLNVLVLGGSGAGKSRGYALPNLLRALSSYVILDPKGELLSTLGNYFEENGIGVSVIDLVNFQGHYNPMAYLRKDVDALQLAHAIVYNTKAKNASGGDPFWNDAAAMLIGSLLLYLMYEAPAEEMNLSTLMYMITTCQVSDEKEDNPLTRLFKELEERDPTHPAVLQFNSFMLAAGKTLQSILISAASNLYPFNAEEFARLTSRDETFIPQLGLQKRAIFLVIPDCDDTYNFLITIFYTQLFQQLFRLADTSILPWRRLKVPVRVMMDEFANVATPSNFKNILAVCRSRGVFCDIILQNMTQLKSLFKDDWESLVSNCDTQVYLGGNENFTFEYISKELGKETITTVSHSTGKGSHGSSSESVQTTARDLMTPDEVRRLDNSKSIVIMRSEDPVIDDKYDLMKDPAIKKIPQGGAKPYEMPYDYMDGVPSITPEMMEEADPGAVPKEILEHYEILNLEEIEYEEESAA